VTRVFRRGELRTAILAALAGIEPANGYAIMQALADAVGGSWRPSPGAIYPAILGLEDAGLLRGSDDGEGGRVYELTAAGKAALAADGDPLTSVADRARTVTPTHTVGSLLDAFAAGVADRSRRLSPTRARQLERLLDTTTDRIAKIVEKETEDG
jgi:DNA-binding PadR family transcriptional regulator